MARTPTNTEKKGSDSKPEGEGAAPQQSTAPAASASTEKRKINVHRFNIGGYIEVDPRKVDTIVKAATSINEVLEKLKKDGAVIQREEMVFTSTTVGAAGEETPEE